MKRFLLQIFLLVLCGSALAQTKSMPEYLSSAGFTQVDDSTWTIEGRAIVKIEGNNVKAFEAMQDHAWTMTFGNGAKQGAVVNVKSGDAITFANGKLTFADGSAYCPATTNSSVMFKRSILRSAIFNASRDMLFVTDIKTVNPKAESLGTYIPASSTTGYALDAYGNFSEKVKAERAQTEAELQSKRNANNMKLEDAKGRMEFEAYDELCNKYGKNVIDGLKNGKIMVGAPMELVNQMLSTKQNGYDFSYGSKVVSSNGNYETREFSPEVYSPHEFHTHYYVTYSKKTNCVTSYSIRRPRPYY